MPVLDEPDGWSRYSATRTDREPRALAQTLRHAGDGRDRRAVDLGSGAETVALLRRGWRVLAIDPDPTAARATAHRAIRTVGS
jgi:hypothetical protein